MEPTACLLLGPKPQNTSWLTDLRRTGLRTLEASYSVNPLTSSAISAHLSKASSLNTCAGV